MATNIETPTPQRHVRWVRRPLHIVGANRRAYIVLNAALYGLLIAGFVVGLLIPELSAQRVETLENNGTRDEVLGLLGNVWLFAAGILANNALRVGLLSIAVPSMIVPFAGVAIFAYSSFEIGVSLSASGSDLWGVMAPHVLTVVIELQAYVLLTLGAYVLGKAWLVPRTVGASNRRRGYLRGLRQLGWLSLPAIVLLIIGAIYEAVTLIYVILPQIAGATQ
jgi:hypothetical protein